MPQDFVVTHGTAFHEFRVQISASTGPWKWLILFMVGLILANQHSSWKWWLALSFLMILFLSQASGRSESIIVFPGHGIQLETRNGFEKMSATTRRFIPLTVIRDVIINEGLYGWNVRYYLAVMTEDPLGHQEIHVAFANVLPRFPVLLEVYNGIHDILEESKINM
ncbi:hypothetical protein BDZ89DRAFT_284236 [Hymenopellis radicata]|nr:hypothetical protein BDZ89DRAFT_284236 [Hymenopellis radicata]